MHQQCLNQMSSAPSPPGARTGSAIGSVRRSIIFPRRSSLSRAASSFLSNKKGSASKIDEEHGHQAKYTASAAGSSPNSRRRRRPLKPCLSSSSLQSSFSSSFSTLDSSTSTISSYEQRSPAKSVSFDEVRVREYGITKGCTTSCIPSGGPSISLSWYYNPIETKICVDQYERYKATRRRRTSRDLILSPRERVAMTREYGGNE